MENWPLTLPRVLIWMHWTSQIIIENINVCKELSLTFSRGQMLLQMVWSIPPLHYRGLKTGPAVLQREPLLKHSSTHFLLSWTLACGHNTSSCKLPLLTCTGAPVVLYCQKRSNFNLRLSHEFYNVELKDWGRKIKSWILIKGVFSASQGETIMKNKRF